MIRLALAFCLLASVVRAQALDDTPRNAVASAFPPEIVALLAATEDKTQHLVGQVAFTTGTLDGRDVVLFLSGVSMVNAAMTTQMAIENFAVDSIVFSGIAGGVDPALNIGDVVVADRWSPYFDIHFAREAADGSRSFPPWFAPTLPGFGALYPRGVRLFEGGGPAGGLSMWLDVDPVLLARAEAAAAGLQLADCTGAGSCLEEPPQFVLGGSGVSGSAFVDNAAFRDYVFATFGARVLDMESAAVAQVAATNGVPFIAFRSLSDLAGGGEGENEMEVFFGLAAENAARAVRAYLAVP